MPGTAATHMIFFIVSVVVASSLVGILYVRTHEISSGIEEKAGSFALELRTEIKIINDPEEVQWVDDAGGGSLIFYIKNTGSTIIGTDTIIAIYDGNGSTPNSVTFVNKSKSSWMPESTIEIKITTPEPAEGQHRIKIIVDNNADDIIDFIY